MAKDTAELIQLLQQQIQLQQQAMKDQQRQMASLVQELKTKSTDSQPGQAVSIPSFTAFESTSELWKDYWARFNTFVKANSVPNDRLPQVSYKPKSEYIQPTNHDGGTTDTTKGCQ
jgi:hypothetical protein